MAFTQAQIDALEAQLAKGIKKVRYPSGEEVEFASLKDMQGVLDQMKKEVLPEAQTAVKVLF